MLHLFWKWGCSLGNTFSCAWQQGPVSCTYFIGTDQKPAGDVERKEEGFGPREVCQIKHTHTCTHEQGCDTARPSHMRSNHI